MRTRFDQQLAELHTGLITMGALCEDAIASVAKALIEGDTERLPAVFDAAERLKEMERDVEAQCLGLLLRQQPVARDLREISSALKMIYDLSRIGDQAADVAELLPYVGSHPLPPSLPMGEMARAVIRMVTDSVDAFVKKDADAARAVIVFDDTVDALFSGVKEELTSLIREGGEDAEWCLDLLMTAKYFERIGDHAVNVAGWVIFSVTGRHEGEEI